MKKLPDIYKAVIDHDSNLETFYTKDVKKSTSETYPVLTRQEIDQILHRIFKNPSYSYTKRVRVGIGDRTFETRFIHRMQGQLLTIDKEVLDISSITFLEIL